MRRVTRNLVLSLVGVLVLLLALGALPGLLGSGDPYYVTATPVGGDGTPSTGTAGDGNATTAMSDEANVTAGDDGGLVDGDNLSERTYPYTTAALENASAAEAGRSGAYRTGPVGFKEAFTHSPFDEVDALRQQHPNATADDGVAVRRNGTLYRVAVTQSVDE